MNAATASGLAAASAARAGRRPHLPRRLRAAFVSFRFGGADGVSVEAAKWQWALDVLGWDTYRVAGELLDGTGRDDVELPGLALQPGPGIRTSVAEVASALADADIVVVENLLSLPLNPSAARVVAGALRRAGVQVVLHHHDLPWQGRRTDLGTGLGRDGVAAFPPGAAHVTINARSRRELAARGVTARRLFNHFDFDQPTGDRAGTRARLGVDDDDLLLVQPTRAIPRKNVPAGIAFAESLQRHTRRRVVYWLSGAAEEDYSAELDALIGRARVPVLRAGAARIGDLYAASDAVVFPSTWEGFGNPVIESICARRPIAVGGYPVLGELRRLGLRFLSLRRPLDVLRAVEGESAGALLDRNFAAARRHLCLRRLPGRLAGVLAAGGVNAAAPPRRGLPAG